jgi:hypothetical protein
MAKQNDKFYYMRAASISANMSRLLIREYACYKWDFDYCDWSGVQRLRNRNGGQVHHL